MQVKALGYYHELQGNIPRAIEMYHISLKMHNELDNKHGMATAYNNIGIVHKYQGEFDLSLDYYQKSLTLREEIGNKLRIATSLNNIGALHEQ
ncbi:MAG: tetratricopeptide repeat protein, partial [Nitrosopumilus sp.]